MRERREDGGEGTSGHREIDHPADLALRLWAPTEEELLCEGGRAIVAILCGGGVVARASSRALELETVDAEDRLVRFMNEVLHLATVEGFLFADGAITLRRGGLSATLVGEPGALDRIVVELKSVTYHDVAFVREPGRLETTVVVDV